MALQFSCVFSQPMVSHTSEPFPVLLHYLSIWSLTCHCSAMSLQSECTGICLYSPSIM